MRQIMLEDINKSFKVWERPEKVGVIKGLFARRARQVMALENISFSIDEGELVGYIGPNGAGKSTTVKIMSGILNPDSGYCRIIDCVPWNDRVAHVARIGVVFGQRSQLWWDLPVTDSFDLLSDIYKLPKSEYRKRSSELVEILNIGDLLKTPVRQLSLGQRMRCEIAASLLHSPRILFLDEPTIGLDAVSKLALREFLKRENQKNAVTMILTTHDMDDIEVLCERVMVIGKGRLLYDGRLADLKNKYAPLRCIQATGGGIPSVENMKGAVEIKSDGALCRVWFDPAKTPVYVMMERIVERFKESHIPLSDIVMLEQDIDEIISAMYKELDI